MHNVLKESYALTAWTYLQILEIRDADMLLDEGKRIDLAGKIGIAYHDPPGVKDLEETWQRKVGLLPSYAETIEKAKRMIDRLTSGKVFNDE